MKSTRILGAVAAITLVAMVGCAKDEKPEAFFQAAIIAADGRPQELWNALPASYHKDVSGLLAAFAGKMNEQMWNEGFVVAQKLVKVLDTKRDFIFSHPQVAQMFPKREEIEKGWDPAVRTLTRLTASDLSTLERLKALDMEKFLAGPVAETMQDLIKVSEVASKNAPVPGSSPDFATLRTQLKAAKITVESVDGDTAKLKIEMEGQPTEVEEMVKVEGKWVPKKLAEGWAAGMVDAKKSIEGITIEPAMVAQFAGIKGMAEAVLDGMLAAKTQDEFNAQVATVMQAFGGRALAGAAAPPAAGEAEAAADTPPSKKAKKAKKGKKAKK